MSDTRLWSYTTTTDLLAGSPTHRIPERDLFAEVVARAVGEVETDDGQHAVDAYRWITRQHYGFRLYCGALGLDPARVARIIADRFGQRIAAIRKRLREAKH